jgi:hypothetical protein
MGVKNQHSYTSVCNLGMLKKMQHNEATSQLLHVDHRKNYPIYFENKYEAAILVLETN